MSVAQWSQTAASNANVDAAINWAEGQSPGSVNDSARAMMAAIAKWRDDHGGAITTTGSATAYTLATNQSVGALSASALDGFLVVATLHARSGAAPTLAVDGRAAAAITLDGTTAPPAGYLPAGSIVAFAWDNAATSWVIQERPFGLLGHLPEAIKTADYTVVAYADAGKALVANKATAITFNLPAAASAGTTPILVRNIGAGTLTLDPSGSEQIEGATTLALVTGDAALIWCNGTAWRAFISPTLGNAARLNLASQAEAEAGTSSTTLMTPERTAQAIAVGVTGRPLHSVVSTLATMSTTTASIPFDDTIPQISEGVEILTATITPKATTSVLIIEAEVNCAANAAGVISGAIFQDSATDALFSAGRYAGGGEFGTLQFSGKVTAGTTSATTIRLRVGPQSGATTLTINGVTGARRYGGSLISSLRITEIKG